MIQHIRLLYRKKIHFYARATFIGRRVQRGMYTILGEASCTLQTLCLTSERMLDTALIGYRVKLQSLVTELSYRVKFRSLVRVWLATELSYRVWLATELR